ncbi:hypothetical protein DUV58_19610 [Salmonella enterica subsp. enterica serovar Caracas]|nr:hypothetical protein [Salmonella enterica subsp. enterica serovar Caracas]
MILDNGFHLFHILIDLTKDTFHIISIFDGMPENINFMKHKQPPKIMSKTKTISTVKKDNSGDYQVSLLSIIRIQQINFLNCPSVNIPFWTKA